MKKENNTPKGEAMPEIQNECEQIILPTSPEEIKKTLEAQIKKYDSLNRLVNERLLFISKKEQLTAFIEQMKTEVRGENLETRICKMVLTEPSTYKTEGITISNSFIIEKALRFIIEEINEKVKVIESNILAIS